MTDLLMIVPSRSRPHNIAELLEAWNATSSGAARLLIAVDHDDPELPRYLRLFDGAADAFQPLQPIRDDRSSALFSIVPRERLGPTLNRVALAAGVDGGYFAVGFMGDDHRPRTHGWDRLLVQALRDLGTGLAYGNDLLQGASLPTAVAMTSDIIATLGYMVPPGMVHMYIDDAWRALGTELGRITYLPDVVIEHLHPVAGKAEWDAGYLEVNAPEQYAADRAVFTRWLAESLQVEVAKLRQVAA